MYVSPPSYQQTRDSTTGGVVEAPRRKIATLFIVSWVVSGIYGKPPLSHQGAEGILHTLYGMRLYRWYFTKVHCINAPSGGGP